MVGINTDTENISELLKLIGQSSEFQRDMPIKMRRV